MGNGESAESAKSAKSAMSTIPQYKNSQQLADREILDIEKYIKFGIFPENDKFRVFSSKACQHALDLTVNILIETWDNIFDAANVSVNASFKTFSPGVIGRFIRFYTRIEHRKAIDFSEEKEFELTKNGKSFKVVTNHAWAFAYSLLQYINSITTYANINTSYITFIYIATGYGEKYYKNGDKFCSIFSQIGGVSILGLLLQLRVKTGFDISEYLEFAYSIDKEKTKDEILKSDLDVSEIAKIPDEIATIFWLRDGIRKKKKISSCSSLVKYEKSDLPVCYETYYPPGREESFRIFSFAVEEKNLRTRNRWHFFALTEERRRDEMEILALMIEHLCVTVCSYLVEKTERRLRDIKEFIATFSAHNISAVFELGKEGEIMRFSYGNLSDIHWGYGGEKFVMLSKKIAESRLDTQASNCEEMIFEFLGRHGDKYPEPLAVAIVDFAR